MDSNHDQYPWVLSIAENVLPRIDSKLWLYDALVENEIAGHQHEEAELITFAIIAPVCQFVG